MSKRGSGKVKKRLVAVSSAAIMAVYAAGYSRTRAAADRLEAQSTERRPPQLRPEPVGTAVPLRQITTATEPTPNAETKTVLVAKALNPATELPAPTATPASPIASTPLLVEAPPPVPEHKAEPAPAAPPPTPPAPRWKDGTYTGWGTSRHGDIQASVVIEGGRIKDATIAQCLTRYSCDIIDKLPPQVAQRQSPETDFVSGATQSTNAFYYGVVEALAKSSDAAKADAAKAN